MIESIIKGQTGDAVLKVMQLYPLDGDVLDLTYGEAGGFWTRLGGDPAAVGVARSFRWLGPDADFLDVNLPDETADTTVYDPPFVSPGGRDTSTAHDFNRRFGLARTPDGPEALYQQIIIPGLAEAMRLTRRGGRVWFKNMSYVNGGKVRWFDKRLLEEIEARGFVLEDEFLLHTGPGPQPKTNRDGSERLQRHARRTHSNLMILRRPKRLKAVRVPSKECVSPQPG